MNGLHDERELSVVVASANGLPYLEACLTSLRERCVEAEVIVADCTNEETRRRVREQFPSARLLSFDEPMTMPALRAAGIAAAHTPYVAVIEDPCVVTDGWSRRIVEAHRRGHSAVGGSIRQGATARARDWAAFFCEYSEYMEPAHAGSVRVLLGMNVSYDRRALGAVEELLRKGHWEFPVHARLRSLGFELYSDPAILIVHIKDYGFREFFSQCYDHSSSFARMRSADLGWRRVVYAAGSPLLVPYLYLRIARNVLERHRHRRELLLATPLIAVYLSVSAAGEMIGYVQGGRQSLPDVN